jgi:large subunit ribosomal protein L18
MRDYKLKFDIRKKRLRSKLAQYSGRLRLSVFRSNKHIYAQVIDDSESKTLVSASTVEKEVRKQNKSNCNNDAAVIVGSLIGKRAAEAGLKEVVFDKGGYKYHGLVKSLADSARKFLNF